MLIEVSGGVLLKKTVSGFASSTVLAFEPQNTIILDYQATLVQYINNGENYSYTKQAKCYKPRHTYFKWIHYRPSKSTEVQNVKGSGHSSIVLQIRKPQLLSYRYAWFQRAIDYSTNILVSYDGQVYGDHFAPDSRQWKALWITRVWK